MRRAGHLMVKLRADAAISHAPAHLDVLAGAARPLGSIDGGGQVDRCIHRRVDAIRVRRTFNARRSLGRIGEQASRFDDLERSMGLSHMLSVEISDPDRSDVLVAELRSLDVVEWASVEQLAQAPLDAFGFSVAGVLSHDAVWRPHHRIHARAALELEPGDRHIKVAVIDTGVSLQHAELSGRLHTGFDTVDLGIGLVAGGIRLVGDSRGRDFCASDETGHGSQVAGILGARGIHLPPGLAGQSSLVPVRSLAAAAVDADRVVGVGSILDIDAGIKVAIDLGAKILNMSFGTPRDSLDADAPPPHSDVIAYAVARDVIPIAAIGNSGKREEYFPAALPQVIAVGSMSEDGQRSEFSTWGGHITLCAPGERIVSAGLKGYQENSGTSFAAPFVSGTAALMAARARQQGKKLDVAMVRRALIESAQAAADPHPNPETGYGLLDSASALRYLDRMLVSRGGDARGD